MQATDPGAAPAPTPDAPAAPPASLVARLKRLSDYFGTQRLGWSLAIVATLVGAVTEPLIPALLLLAALLYEAARRAFTAFKKE